MKRAIFYLIVSVLSAAVLMCTAALTLYPLKYFDLVQTESERYDIDPYLIQAIIKTESGFDPRALSKKAALGLMQVQYETAIWCAKNMDITEPEEQELYEPEMNISIGTWYFSKYLLTRFSGSLPLSLAAYNAGLGNVQKWLENRQYSEDGKTLQKIPFKETENFVKRVMKSYRIYKHLYEGIYPLKIIAAILS